MIDAARFVDRLSTLGVRLFTGVPDSLLKPLNAEIVRSVPQDAHVIAANEGSSVAMAVGHYLRTGSPAVVYLQNSGFGNAINPLLSLVDPDVYGIPMIVLVGWRGQPGVKDEPQHLAQGRLQTQLLDSLEVPWAVLSSDPEEAESQLDGALRAAQERGGPYVLLVEKGTFGEAGHPVGPTEGPTGLETMSREAALEAVVEALGTETVNIATTGMLSRELFELRERTGSSGVRDFLTVGGMGHASSIALGVALQEHEREVWCLDGDGALLMHLGALPIIADRAPGNLFHVVFNNGVHDSVGGQPTSVGVMDIAAAARAMGYRWSASTHEPDEIAHLIERMRDDRGPSLLEVRVRPGNRPDIGRPTRSPREAKERFMAALGAEWR